MRKSCCPVGLWLAVMLALGMGPVTGRAAQTSNGVASASSRWYGGDPYTWPSLAFDGNLDMYHGWANNNDIPSWLQYDFDKRKAVTNYSIFCRNAQYGGFNYLYQPKTWTLEGSNTTSGGWVTLDTQADGGLTIDTWKSFPIPQHGLLRGVSAQHQRNGRRVRLRICHRA